jgi:hypothetical protein
MATAAAPATLRSFLQGRRVTSSAWNLTGMSTDAGKYYIPDDEYGIFLQRYHDHVFVRNQPAHLLERHSPDASPVLIDLDFRYALGDETATRRYTSDAVERFVTAYASALHYFLDVGGETEDLHFYVQETPAPRVEKEQIKDGIHIICPDIRLNYADLFALRQYILNKGVIAECFPDITNTADDCFDKSVIQTNNWFLYGSSKSAGRTPYTVSRCFALVTANGTVTEEPATLVSELFIKMFSIRTDSVSDYGVRPTRHEEWGNIKPPSKSISKKTKKVSAIIAPPAPSVDDNQSVLSERINDIINYEGLTWDIVQKDGGYQLTHNSKRCLVVPTHEHSDLKHSCVYAQKHCAILSCLSHSTKRLSTKIATALWKYLSEDSATSALSKLYVTLKTAFEQNVFRVLDPPGYMVRVCDKWIHYNRAQLTDMNSGIFLDDDKKKRFIDEWLRDETIRTYARMDYFVDPADCPPQVFNTFEGLAAARLPDISADIVESDLIKPILDHVAIICNHQADAIEFFLDWFASIVQHPGILNGIALIIIGQHGCGKDIFLTWFGTAVIGRENYYKTARPQVDLFGAFNSSRKNVLFYHIEEANTTSIQAAMVEQFKNYITDPYASIQIKNKNTTTGDSLVKNYNHFAVSTNHNIPFQIELTERRIFAVKASAEKCKKQAYFKKLIDAMADSSVIRCFYNFLMKRKLSARDWCNPPVTPALTAWKEECMPRLQPFLDWYKASDEPTVDVLASNIYTEYLKWCETIKDDEPISYRAFGLEMKQLSGVSKGHSRIGNVYTII